MCAHEQHRARRILSLCFQPFAATHPETGVVVGFGSFANDFRDGLAFVFVLVFFGIA